MEAEYTSDPAMAKEQGGGGGGGGGGGEGRAIAPSPPPVSTPYGHGGPCQWSGNMGTDREGTLLQCGGHVGACRVCGLLVISAPC